MMYYMFLFDRLVTVEFRKYNLKAKGKPDRHVWPIRNNFWSRIGPATCFQAESSINDKKARCKIIDAFGGFWRWNLETLIHSKNTVATNQIIRYPDVSDDSRYTFSLWGVSGGDLREGLAEIYQVGEGLLRDQGLPHEYVARGLPDCEGSAGAAVLFVQGQRDGRSDPVSTANPRWKPFLADYNEWCSGEGGVPLANQTFGFTHEQAKKALGERLAAMAAKRAEFDPQNRLLNDFFKVFFSRD